MKEMFEEDPDSSPIEDREAARTSFLALIAQSKSRRVKKAVVFSRADELLKTLRVQKQEAYFNDQLSVLLKQLDSVLRTEGLHRKAGGKLATAPLKVKIDKGEKVEVDPKALDSEHVAADLLKYLFTVPYRNGETLIPSSVLEEFANSTVSDMDQLAKTFFDMLPAANQAAFLQILDHLTGVAANVDATRMSATNLALIYGTKLVHPKLEGMKRLSIETRASAVMEILINRRMSGGLSLQA